MEQDVELGCRCGEVRGIVKGASRESVNRIVCYCDDCQAFLHHLGRVDLLDAHGGTDIVQVAPACLSFHRGTERIVGLRLTEKGLYRWYAGCCKTPLGNSMKPAIPFVGIVAQAFAAGERSPDAIFGAPIGAILGRFAVGEAPAGSTDFNVRLLARAARKVVGWRLSGKALPHPFFDRKTGAPAHRLTILSPAERQALRPLCGPHPTARPDAARAAADA